MNELKGLDKIFFFTFRQQTRRKGYLASLILVSLLCFLLPFGILTGAAWFDREPGETDAAPVPETVVAEPEESFLRDEVLLEVKNLYVVNLSGENAFDGAAVESSLPEHMTVADYGEDLDRAVRDSSGSSDTLLLVAERQQDAFALNLLLPEKSTLDSMAASMLMPLIDSYGMQVVEEGRPAEETAVPEKNQDPAGDIQVILGLVIPYLNIMLLYFFVLFYGQGVAQSVLMEKTSRLMEFFLVSVKPSAMILGKISAVCLSGVLQIGSWILALILGFALGGAAAKQVNPEADFLVLELLDSFGALAGGMFSVSGVILALVMIVAGMFLYCSLAGMGGAMAGKPEDLSSTNTAFTLILVASFFACLLAGESPWLDWIPFTAIMITPARILLGSVSLVKGLGSLAVVLSASLFFTLLAGRMYQLMALYKGQLPGPKQMAELMKQK